MKTQITDRRTRTLNGDLAGVTILCDDKGKPKIVEYAPIGDTTCAPPRQMSPEIIESLGAMLGKMREEAGDKRKVCPSHGYHDGYNTCPTCEDEELAVDGRERCETCSKAKGWRQYHLPGEHTVKAEQVI